MVDKNSNSDISWGKWVTEWVVSHPGATGAICSFATIFGITSSVWVSGHYGGHDQRQRTAEAKINYNFVLTTVGASSAIFGSSVIASQNDKTYQTRDSWIDVGVFSGTGIAPIMVAAMMPKEERGISIVNAPILGVIAGIGYEIVTAFMHKNSKISTGANQQSTNQVTTDTEPQNTKKQTLSPTQQPAIITTTPTRPPQTTTSTPPNTEDQDTKQHVSTVSTTQRPITDPVPQTTTTSVPQAQQNDEKKIEKAITIELTDSSFSDLDSQGKQQKISEVAVNIKCLQAVSVEGKLDLPYITQIRLTEKLNDVICPKVAEKNQITEFITRLNEIQPTEGAESTISSVLQNLVCEQHIEKDSLRSSLPKVKKRINSQVVDVFSKLTCDISTPEEFEKGFSNKLEESLRQEIKQSSADTFDKIAKDIVCNKNMAIDDFREDLGLGYILSHSQHSRLIQTLENVHCFRLHEVNADQIQTIITELNVEGKEITAFAKKCICEDRILPSSLLKHEKLEDLPSDTYDMFMGAINALNENTEMQCQT